MEEQQLLKLVNSALGNEQVDCLLCNARVVNVFTGDIEARDVAVSNGFVVGFGDYDAKQRVDLDGAYVMPGFIDAHVHPESAMLEPGRWAEEILPLGTTTVVADPHEIANVMGMAGMQFMAERGEQIPLNVCLMAPSCVPATHLETTGANLGPEEVDELLDSDGVTGLAEMMNVPGVLFGLDPVIKKLCAALERRMPIDGHAPGLGGKQLSAYIAAGITTDHESFTAEEAGEKLALGMHLIIREGSAARNLATLLPVVNVRNASRCMFGTDDRHPSDLCDRGHINSMLRQAVGLGLDPVTAIRMATLNTALHFGLQRTGAVAPGYRADLVVCQDLTEFRPIAVFAEGRKVAENGKALFAAPAWTGNWPNRFALPAMTRDVFALRRTENVGPVIEVVPGQIITKAASCDLRKDGDTVLADVERDLLKLFVIERYTGRGGRAGALVRGFGMKRGAIATSIAHDSHNVIVVGAGDADMLQAVQALQACGGGLAVSCDGEVDVLPLPVAGLMSDLSGDDVRAKLHVLSEMTRQTGCVLDEPFMLLSFLALPVIPELKLTDKGLVDVGKFDFIPGYE